MIPVLPYFLAYCSGILAWIPAAREFLLPWFLPVSAAVCATCIFYKREKRQPAWKWTALVLLAPLGYFLPQWQTSALPENHILQRLDETQKASATGTIIEPPKLFADKVQYTVKLETVQYPSAASPLRVTGNARITLYNPENRLRAGDRILINKVRLKRPRNFKNPGSFDYENYMRSRGVDVIGGISKPKSIKKIGHTALPLYARLPMAIKERMLATIDKNLAREESGLLKAMLFGDKNFLSDELRESYIASGLAHLMAVSGLHIGFVAGAVFSLLYPAVFSLLYKYWPEAAMAGWSKKITASLCFIPLIFYMLIVGAKFSSLRAGMMVAVFLLAILADRERSLFNALALAAFLILLWQPLALMEPGFQLSFFAVLAILYALRLRDKFQGDVIDRMGEVPVHRRIWNYGGTGLGIPGWFLSIFAASAFISLAANLGTLPILIHHFHRISLAGFPLNIFMVPLASLLIPLALFLLAIGFVWQFFADAFFPLVGLLLQFFLIIPQYAATFSYASMYVPKPPTGWSLLYYFVLFGLPWMFYKRRQFVTANPLSRRKMWRSPMPWALAAAALMTAVWFVWPRWPQGESDRLSITLLDIGQGESIFVEFPNHQTMLIDGGGFYKNSYNVGKFILGPYILRKGLRRIDYMAVTHSDNDHISGLESALDIIKTDHFLVRENPLGDLRIKNLREKALRLGAELVLLEVGKPLNIGEVALTLLHPDRGYLRQRDKRGQRVSNDLSLVMRLDYRQFSMLLTGDINHKAEEYLVRGKAPLAAMVLKAPHHGSRFSNSAEFVKAVSPRDVLFSMGYLNFFRHPDPSVVERYINAGAKIRRTDLHGAITVITDGHGYHIEDHRSRQRKK